MTKPEAQALAEAFHQEGLLGFNAEVRLPLYPNDPWQVRYLQAETFTDYFQGWAYLRGFKAGVAAR